MQPNNLTFSHILQPLFRNNYQIINLQCIGRKAAQRVMVTMATAKLKPEVHPRYDVFLSFDSRSCFLCFLQRGRSVVLGCSVETIDKNAFLIKSGLKCCLH